MNTVESLKQLYVKMGGNLSDSYPEIASGIPVSDYVLIPDCISALNKVAGSGSGANVLTLYVGQKDNKLWCYKNPECTEEYESYQDAKSALENADVIVAKGGTVGSAKYFPTASASTNNSVFVAIVGADHDELQEMQVYLFEQSEGSMG